MTQIHYIEPDGTIRSVSVDPGLSVMEGAVNNMVSGIEAECGGACICATCHVYVDEEWLQRLQVTNATEAEMLEAVADERRPNSRLGCQIKVTPALDGLTVRIPTRQT
jgi:2Fe-2S ferredoxin